MEICNEPGGRVRAELQLQESGHVILVLSGRFDLESTGACWRALEKHLRTLQVTLLEIDASQFELQGGVGVALLRYLSEGGMTPGATVTLRGLNDGVRRMLEMFTAEDFRAYRPHPPAKLRIPEEVGAVVVEVLHDLYEQVAFIGGISKALAGTLLHPRCLRWEEIKRVFESAGANALPVVSLFSFLVGLVLALEAARPLAKFGAQIFIADMIGFSAIRDTGPLVTAIMLAGRSGSAFAAELGTMKVNAELDALTTMGLNPIRFLVVQRVIGAMLLTGCLSRPSLVKQSFAFSMPPSASATNVPSGPVLGIRRLTVAPPFDTQSLSYRTGEFSYEQDPYAQFLVPPAESLEEPVRAWFRTGRVFSDVAEPGSALTPNMLVEITVEQLYGDFRNPARPSAVLALRFIFFRAPEGAPAKVFLEKDYVRRVPFKARTAAAVMAGWNEALKEIMNQVASDVKAAVLD